VRVSNGKNIEYITFEKGAVGLKYANRKIKIDTTSSFSRYSVRMGRGIIQLYRDGKVILKARLKADCAADETIFRSAAFRTPYMSNNSLIIGSLSNEGKGTAVWRNVRLISPSTLVKDMAVLICTDKTEKEVKAYFK
jgi:hypothetical protein